ncbi:37S ribosomal protein S24, mitochondrial [Scheffersomyces spartinae]|uniref:37S ribosomal protein S24, mitochondrial n=1 Tax=Scheffersomyces spartinae TaxID=45513 RepID=A0A9P7V5H0_9ASCO|nr:37S ribosomal protein S24, mitochondrial [Scheffersomyces spartinae]KAG7191520.1 37S ribosomal protein S24, mitochondrial [Scheffersomyces spartinae]
MIGALKSCGRRSARLYSNQPLYLNPHQWKGLPSDKIFELHNQRKEALGQYYNPTNEERELILSSLPDLMSRKGDKLDYVFELDNFKERYMNNTPVAQRGLPPKLSNVEVVARGDTPHQKRKNEQITRISAYELPLLANFRQAYQPPSKVNSVLKFKYFTDFSEESTPKNRTVVLTVNIKDLDLTTAQEKKFKLLSGNKFDHNTNVFKFTSKLLPEATQNARRAAEVFNALLTETKNLDDDFADIPLDTRHSKPHTPKPVFPKEWARPQDAPVAKFNIVNTIIEDVKTKKDSQYVKSLSP